jgi:hypothetical protein
MLNGGVTLRASLGAVIRKAARTCCTSTVDTITASIDAMVHEIGLLVEPALHPAPRWSGSSFPARAGMPVTARRCLEFPLAA